jgi:hypothetical protein
MNSRVHFKPSAFPSLALVLASLLWTAPADAVNFNLATLSGLTDTGSKSMIMTAAVGGDYRSFLPASPLGVAIGFDIGVDVTAIYPPSDFSTAFSTVTGQAVPTMIPLPRLNIHKGLPGGFDFGLSALYLSDPAYSVKMYGAELRWAFIRGKIAAPAVTLRGSVDFNTLGFIKTSCYKLDVLASKNFYVLEPYGGLGVQRWAGSLVYDTTLYTLPAGISSENSGVHPHFFAGLVLKIVALKITAEWDYSSAGLTTYGGKVSLGF